MQYDSVEGEICGLSKGSNSEAFQVSNGDFGNFIGFETLTDVSALGIVSAFSKNYTMQGRAGFICEKERSFACSEGEFPFLEKCYGLNRAQMKMSEAEAQCNNEGGQLVRPKSALEAQFIYALADYSDKLTPAEPPITRIWLNYRREDDDIAFIDLVHSK